MKQLPAAFQLGGRNWTVELVDEVDAHGAMGITHGDSAHIRIRSNLDPESLAHTFYHELMHAICYTLGLTKLNKNEDRIDALGNVLLQFMETKKGKLE